MVRRWKHLDDDSAGGLDVGVHTNANADEVRRTQSVRRSIRFRRYFLLTIAIVTIFIFCWLQNDARIVEVGDEDEQDDDADELDFSGGHDVDKAYRIGDVFVVWYFIWLSFDELLHKYANAYPNTLAHQYLVEVGEAKHASRNLTALLRVMDRKEKTMHYRRARKDELVVHLRLGDVLTDPEYADLDISMEELWNQEEGFVNFDADVKSNYNKAEFEELVRRIPEEAAVNIKKCVIVGAGFITYKKHGKRNMQYKELVHSFLEDSLGCEVSYYTSKNPDKDLMFMASAHWLIVAMGGFAQIAAGCVTARRGWGHAIYDKFNGEVASWNHKLLTPEEKRIFRKEYIDWSEVDIEETSLRLH